MKNKTYHPALKIIKIIFDTLGNIILIGIFVFWLVKFPICKLRAEAKFRDFSATYQSVTEDDIDKAVSKKDYGGYTISVRYKSAPEFEYIYSFNDGGSMKCTVYKDGFIVKDGKDLAIPAISGWH